MDFNLQLALIGAAPAIIAMMMFDRWDAKRPEPRWTLRRVAIAGSLSAFAVIFVGEALRRLGPPGLEVTAEGQFSGYDGALYMAFVVAAVPEEAAKLASMFLFAWRRPEFNERMDGIVYGAHAGLGFALVENVAYLLLLPGSVTDYLSLFIGRAALAVPGHATWGALMGYAAAVRRFDNRGPGMLGGYLLAVTLHGAYDAWLFAAPVAIERGHDWLALGFAGVPIVAYAVPTLIVGLGIVLLRAAMVRALADDDLAEAAEQRLASLPGLHVTDLYPFSRPPQSHEADQSGSPPAPGI